MHPVEPAAGCRCGEFVSKTTTDKSGPCYQHAIEKKIIPRAALNSITLPESAGAFIPPTHGSPPRREPTPTSAALKPSPPGAPRQEGKTLQRGEARRNHRAVHPPSVPTAPRSCPASQVSLQPCSASPQPSSVSPQAGDRAGAHMQRRSCKMGWRTKCEGYRYA